MTAEKDKEKLEGLLVQEYLQLQKAVEAFDGRALTIKAWSVTFSAAGLGAAYELHNDLLLLIASLSAATFWLAESVGKVHQRAYYPRIQTIEEYFRGESKAAPAPFQIWHDWYWGYLSWKGFRNWASAPFLLGVMLPHAVVVAAGLLLYRCGPKV